MNARYDRVALTVLLCFALVAVSLTYWSVFAADGMLTRNDNPRRVEDEWAIQRGSLYDRSGELLARSVSIGISPSGKRLWNREYLYPELTGALGYYSRFRGASLAEKAFDTTLTGGEWLDENAKFLNALLHRPQRGGDVRLTLDLAQQRALAAAFQAVNAARGGAVVIEIPTGAVRAMISLPGWDTVKLDDQWETLARAPDAPLRNRVTEGVYQPGGALQTVIYAALLAEEATMTEPPPIGLTDPVQINGLTVNCAHTVTAASVATLQSAYAHGCPFAFVDAVVNFPGPAKVQAMIESMGLLKAPELHAFEAQAGTKQPITLTPLNQISDGNVLRAAAIGQGGLAVTPLQMALVAASIANRGNAVTPYMGEARRLPDADTWESIAPTPLSEAVTTRSVTDLLRTAMREAVISGAAQAALRGAESAGGLPKGATLYGHASLTYATRDLTHAWFIGFVDLADGTSYAVAVIVEATTDVGQAAEIGGRALALAAQHGK